MGRLIGYGFQTFNKIFTGFYPQFTPKNFSISGWKMHARFFELTPIYES